MRRRTRAQAAIEFALILPVLIIVVLGGISASTAWLRYGQAYQALAVGARMAGIHGGDPAPADQTVRDAIRGQLASWGVSDVTFCNVSCEPTGDNAASFAIPAAGVPYGTEMTVVGKYRSTITFPLVWSQEATRRFEIRVISERY